MLGLFLRSWLDGLPRGSNKMLRLAPPTLRVLRCFVTTTQRLGEGLAGVVVHDYVEPFAVVDEGREPLRAASLDKLKRPSFSGQAP
jgi:hypothetical protein